MYIVTLKNVTISSSDRWVFCYSRRGQTLFSLLLGEVNFENEVHFLFCCTACKDMMNVL